MGRKCIKQNKLPLIVYSFGLYNALLMKIALWLLAAFLLAVIAHNAIYAVKVKSNSRKNNS